MARTPDMETNAAGEVTTAADRMKDYDEIAYIPIDGDPVRTKWNGIDFKAHIPVRVPKTSCVSVPMPTEIIAADGTRTTRHTEKKIPMAELAKNNPIFSVNGKEPIKRKVGSTTVPTDSDQYRSYCIAWIAASSSQSEMDARWTAEGELRKQCGCDDKDIAFLRPFFEARHMQAA